MLLIGLETVNRCAAYLGKNGLFGEMLHNGVLFLINRRLLRRCSYEKSCADRRDGWLDFLLMACRGWAGSKSFKWWNPLPVGRLNLCTACGSRVVSGLAQVIHGFCG